MKLLKDLDEEVILGTEQTGKKFEQIHETDEVFKKLFGKELIYADDTNFEDRLEYNTYFIEYVDEPRYFAIIVDLGNGWWSWDGWIIKKTEVRRPGVIELSKKYLRAPTAEPGWYIIQETPYCYNIFSGCFLDREKAVAALQERRERMKLAEPEWRRLELIKIELKITKEDV